MYDQKWPIAKRSHENFSMIILISTSWTFTQFNIRESLFDRFLCETAQQNHLKLVKSEKSSCSFVD